MKLFISVSILFMCASVSATDLQNQKTESPVHYNAARFELAQQAQQNEQEEMQQSIEKKSGLKAAFMSAVVPGAGEVYAKSYWKAALFAGLEVAFWSGVFIYTSRADDKDREMRRYGDEHWSAQQYWSHVYDRSYKGGNWTGDALTQDDNLQVSESDIANNMEALRALETELYSHSLPSTKTQQYYEMIYKYLDQFGVGWDDMYEEFGSWDFYDTMGNYQYLTPNVKTYRSIRNLSNDLYAIADKMVILVMVNHLASMFDAAYTVKKYNRNINYSFRMKPLFNGSGFTNTYGFNFTW